MNRVIKFRAWSSKLNRMIYDGDLIQVHSGIDIKYYSPVSVYHNKVGCTFYETQLPNATEYHFDHPTYIKADAFMQFTGLCDKNGNEIYEGDIIRSSVSVGDVQFSHGVFGIEWSHTKKKKSLLGNFGQLHNLRTMTDDILTRCEIIGNIYQNPSLCEPNT